MESIGGAGPGQDSTWAVWGGCLMWQVPSHETALRWDTPDLIPMQTFWINGEEAASDVIQRSVQQRDASSPANSTVSFGLMHKSRLLQLF